MTYQERKTGRVVSDKPWENEMWVTCEPCAHTWRIAFLPMDMAKLAKLMKGVACPKCGERDKPSNKRGAEKTARIFMATEANIRREFSRLTSQVD